MENETKFSWISFLYSVIFNGAVLAVALLVFVPFFEEIDDTHISMILEGAYGFKEAHTIFTNTILGYVVVSFQNVFPTIRWFVVLQYVFIYIGYVISVYAISKHKRGWLLSVFVVLSTFYEMYVSVQYTKTTAFVCMAGIIALYEYVRDASVFDKKDRYTIITIDNSLKVEKWIYLITGWVLILYGILLRKDGIFLAMVSAAAVGLLELLRTKNIKRYLIAFVPVGVVFILLQAINTYTYSSNALWENVQDYNTVRTVLNDQRCDMLDYSTYGDELTGIGVSENDAIVLLTYQFGDNNVFTYDRLKEIGDSFPPNKIKYKTFANLFENLVNEVKRSYVTATAFMAFIILLITSIVIDRSKSSPGFIRDARYKLLAMILMGMLCFAAFVYFQYMGRYCHRLFAAVVVPAMMVIGYMIDGISLKDNTSKIVFGGNFGDITTALCIVASLGVLGLNGLQWMSNQDEHTEWRTEYVPKLAALDEMVNDTDSYYVADTFTMQNIHKFDLFTVYRENYYQNYITCGSWFINTPITDESIRKHGYTNPYEALMDVDGEVYLIDNICVQNKVQFLNEHYDGEYEAEFTENKGGLDIYKIKLVNE